MLKNTPIWTTGPMNLWVNNKPAKVYVPESNIKSTYEQLQSRLSKEGQIPIGIDHLPDDIIKANPVLAKLDLLNVGNITEIEYADDTIKIVEAELTNPQIRDLYEAGELDMVSIVATSNVSACPQDYDYIVNNTDITRVDIVEKGACPTCNIPKPHDDDTVVYARYSIKQPQKEDENMADEITMEAIEELLDKKLEPINERLDALEAEEEETEEEIEASESDEVKEMEAKVAEMQAKIAETKVDAYIAEGKIIPAQKESMVDLYASKPEAFEKMMEDAPVLIDLDTKKSLVAGDSEEEEKELTPEEENLAKVQAHYSKGD